MKRSMGSCCVFLNLLYASSLALPISAAQPPRFDLDSASKLVRLSDPQVSPDGRSIVVVVARANYEDNRWESELVLVDVATGKQRVLTHERRDVRHPRWSPAGDRLALIAGAMTGKENKPQVFVLPMNGGDAQRITSAPNGIQHFSWKPDGQEIAFATADDATNKKVGDREISFEVGNDHYLTSAAARSSHIWITPSNEDKARRLTAGPWTLPLMLDLGTPTSLAWSPDGKSIAFVKVASPHSGDSDQRSLQLVDVTNGTIRELTGRTKAEGRPLFSPNGVSIAYSYPRDGAQGSVNEIHVTTPSGGAGTNLTELLDRNVYRAIWMPDSKSLLIGGNDGTRGSLWLQPLAGAARRLDLGAVSPGGTYTIDASVSNDGAIAFVGSEAQRPAELYFMASPDAAPKRLSDFNGQVAALSLGKVEKVDWTNDGYPMDGVLTFPPEFSPGKVYPLVLAIHGGPHSASKETFGDLAQLMAARGWLVFQPNYRGSDNLGNKFQTAIRNDAGVGPGRDVMAGIEMLKKRGFVDSSRMAVSGGSYGGYMTVWLIGHYDVWKSAVAVAAVTDHMDQYNLGDANVIRGESFGGSPWVGDFEKAYREQSPIMYAAKIKTPTLILANTADVRVPITQSYKLFHALRDNKVPVQFIAYPSPGHPPSDPLWQQDTTRRWLEWVEKHFERPESSGR